MSNWEARFDFPQSQINVKIDDSSSSNDESKKETPISIKKFISNSKRKVKRNKNTKHKWKFKKQKKLIENSKEPSPELSLKRKRDYDNLEESTESILCNVLSPILLSKQNSTLAKTSSQIESNSPIVLNKNRLKKSKIQLKNIKRRLFNQENCKIIQTCQKNSPSLHQTFNCDNPEINWEISESPVLKSKPSITASLDVDDPKNNGVKTEIDLSSLELSPTIQSKRTIKTNIPSYSNNVGDQTGIDLGNLDLNFITSQSPTFQLKRAPKNEIKINLNKPKINIGTPVSPILVTKRSAKDTNYRDKMEIDLGSLELNYENSENPQPSSSNLQIIDCDLTERNFSSPNQIIFPESPLLKKPLRATISSENIEIIDCDKTEVDLNRPELINSTESPSSLSIGDISIDFHSQEQKNTQNFQIKTQFSTQKSTFSTNEPKLTENISLKTKGKLKKGTYSWKLHELLRIQNSKNKIWEHEIYLEKNQQYIRPQIDDEDLIIELRVCEILKEYDKLLIKCIENNYEKNILIVINPSIVSMKSIDINSIIIIYPPYFHFVQTLNNIEYQILYNVNKIILKNYTFFFITLIKPYSQIHTIKKYTDITVQSQ